MAKLKIFFIASLVLLGILLILTWFRPMVPEQRYGEASSSGTVETEIEYIIEFNVTNTDEEDGIYIFEWSTGGYTYTEEALIKSGHRFTSIRHFQKDKVKDDKVHLAIYKKGSSLPFEESTFYLIH